MSASAPMIAVGSGKGGVGKSFLALNLAWALAELGQRVLLLELDADAGALSIAAGLGEPPPRAPAATSAELAARAYAVPGNSRIQLLRAADIPAQAARSPAALAPWLGAFCEHWRIADLAPGLGAQTILWLRAASEPLLIGAPELACVQAMLRLHRRLQRQHAYERLCELEPRLRGAPPSLPDVQRRLVELTGAECAQQRWRDAARGFHAPRWVFNRVLPDDEMQLARITAYLRAHAGAAAADPRLIPEDGAQLACARLGRPLMSAQPACPAAQAVRSIAAELSARRPQACGAGAARLA